MKKIAALCLVLLIADLCPLTSGAQAPQLINYQGRLLNGTNLVNGNIGLSLRLFKQSSGGIALYEDSNTVTVADGLYSTFIGDHPTNDAFLAALASAEVWVEATVNGSTLSPRERLASVGYSLSTRGLLVTTNGIVIHNPGVNSATNDSQFATIGGGLANNIGEFGRYATIAGGAANRILGQDSAIGGGVDNQIIGSQAATIAGGYQNTILDACFGSVIGGGYNNEVDAFGQYATIAGGFWNSIQSNSSYSAVGGGKYNRVDSFSEYAAIAGGSDNDIGRSSSFSTISGGRDNNTAGSSEYTAIAGGWLNDIGTNSSLSSIGGGFDNNVHPHSQFATIPGGRENVVGTNAPYAFAAGRSAQALHAGSFVWADASGSPFASAQSNEFALRAGGGVRIEAPSLNLVGGTFSGSGTGISNVPGSALQPGSVAATQLATNAVTSATIVDGTITHADVAANSFWATTGNAGTVTGTHFLGTTDNLPLEIRVNNERAALIQPSNGAPNLVLGAAQNAVANGTRGSSILGGSNNTISANSSFTAIGGGQDNNVAANSEYTTIAGGRQNDVGTNSDYVAIGGGQDNNVAANSAYATIAGGVAINIGTNAGYSSIGGGWFHNVADNSEYATISGGGGNSIGNNSDYSVIGGGQGNNVANNSFIATIAGGFLNTIGTNSSHSSIGGGYNNDVHRDSANATIAGGAFNDIGTNSLFAAIGGGRANDVAANSLYATISGGGVNNIGVNASFSVIAGGMSNLIGEASLYGAILGGRDNRIGNSATNALAAGRRAVASHRGSFVWADDTDADFASTAANQFLIRASGGVGIGTNNPASRLHLSGTNSEELLRIDHTPSGGRVQLVSRPSSFGPSYVGTVDTNDFSIVQGNNLRITVKNSGNVGIGTSSPTSTLHVAGTITATGPVNGQIFNATSDRNAKQDIAPVDAAAILEKISALPVAMWSFKTEPDVKHIGPMAQDFRAAFGLGPNDTSIATVDADGVALAAIQALKKQLDEQKVAKDAEVSELKQTILDLRARLDALETK